MRNGRDVHVSFTLNSNTWYPICRTLGTSFCEPIEQKPRKVPMKVWHELTADGKRSYPDVSTSSRSLQAHTHSYTYIRSSVFVCGNHRSFVYFQTKLPSRSRHKKAGSWLRSAACVYLTRAIVRLFEICQSRVNGSVSDTLGRPWDCCTCSAKDSVYVVHKSSICQPQSPKRQIIYTNTASPH